MTWSTSPGLTLARSTAALMTWEARSAAGVEAKAPSNLPIAVRAPLTRTTSSMTCLLVLPRVPYPPTPPNGKVIIGGEESGKEFFYPARKLDYTRATQPDRAGLKPEGAR